MARRLVVFFFLASLALSASTAQATSITVSTDISGANTQIDQDNWFVWTFSVAPTYTVDDILGSFVIKRGANTDEPIVFSLFDADASAWDLSQINTETPLAFFSKPETDVDNAYGTELFTLGPSLGVTDSNPIYSLVLWSNADASGAYQFFFKGEDNQTLIVTPCGIIDGDNVNCNSDPDPDPDPDPLPDASLPEPSTVILTLSGIGLIVLKRMRS